MFLILFIPIVYCFLGISKKISGCSIATEEDKCSIKCGLSEQARCAILGDERIKKFTHCTCLETSASIELKEKDECKDELKKLKATLDENIKNITKTYEAKLKEKDKEITKLKGGIQTLKKKPKDEKKKENKEKPKKVDTQKEKKSKEGNNNNNK